MSASAFDPLPLLRDQEVVSGDPVALVHGDAATALGARNVMSLEEAMYRSCRFGQPKPRSIVVQLRVLYDRLATHYVSRSKLAAAPEYLSENAGPSLSPY